MDASTLINKGLIHSVHNSERQAFACKQAWDWKYRQRYSPKKISPALEFGSAWHKAMEIWYETAMWKGDREKQAQLAIKEFLLTVDEQLKNYIRLNGTPADSYMTERNERCKLGVEMLKYYFGKVSPELDKGLTPLGTEVSFEVPLDIWCRCDSCWKLWDNTSEHRQDLNDFVKYGFHESIYHEVGWQGLPVTFGGTIDIIFQDVMDRILLDDWKTRDKLLAEEHHSYLDIDPQIEGYCAAVYKSGRQCDGFLYHEQRKEVPREPVMLARRYKGKLVSTNKNAPVEYETALKFIRENDPDGFKQGLYSDYFWYLRSHERPKFYQRIPIYKTETQLEIFWKDLKLEVADMLAVEEAYPQPQMYKCKFCDYKIPCEAKKRGEDYQLILDTKFIKD